jgi:drug/metabolite transporter (DMT)-like permease
MPSGASTYLMLTGTMALFGTAFTASKIVASAVPPEVAALLRFGCGAIVLLLWLTFTGHGFTLAARDWGRVLAAGTLGVFAFNLLFFWGLHMAPSIDGSIIVPVLSPVLTTAVAALFLKESATPARLVAMTVGIAGAAVFLAGLGGATGGRRLIGDLAYVVGAAVWSAYTLIGRRILTGIEPVKAIALTTTVGSLLLATVAAPKIASVAWSGLPAGFWLNIAYLALGPTAVAYAGYYRGIQVVGPTRASAMMFLVPVFGVTGGALFLHESLTAAQAVGALLMLAGALLALTDRRVTVRRHANRDNR